MRFFPRIIDGGTGTELERRGAAMNSVAWSAAAVLSHPDLLCAVHRSFAEAGAELLIANTFSAALHNLSLAGLADRFEEINREAVLLALRAAGDAETAGTGRRPLVAGALSTTTFTGALDHARLPSGDAAEGYWARQATIQAEAGAELIILEMMRDVEHTGYALAGALRTGLPVWVGFTCYAGMDGEAYLLDTDIPLERALTELDMGAARAVGVMHTLVEHAPAAVGALGAHWSGDTFCYPHAGRFEMPHWVFQDVIEPEDFARQGLALRGQGVGAVGGCCGIGPAHIRALADALADAAASAPASD